MDTINTDIASTLGLVSEEQYAKLRNIQLGQVRNERSAGRGPAYVKLGKRVMYPLEAVRRYICENTITPTSAATLIDGTPRRGRRDSAAA